MRLRSAGKHPGPGGGTPSWSAGWGGEKWANFEIAHAHMTESGRQSRDAGMMRGCIVLLDGCVTAHIIGLSFWIPEETEPLCIGYTQSLVVLDSRGRKRRR